MTLNPIVRGALLASVLLFQGATIPVAHAQSAPAPKWNVGDKWVYNVKSGVGISPINYQETREVVSVGGGITKLKITGKTAEGQDFTRVDEYAGPGAMKFGAPCADEAYRFPTPLQRVTFPASPGQRSSKWIDVINEPGGGRGQVNYAFRTRSWEQQTVPAGSFNALRVDVNMALDDSTPFRNPTNCTFVYWYSPEARATVREHRWAQYTEIGDLQGRMPVLNKYYELASFTPGK